MTVDELAAAIRAYVGRPRTREYPNRKTWYIDISSTESDEDIRQLAEDIIRAGAEAAATSAAIQPAQPTDE